jgi:hypothetical protein
MSSSAARVRRHRERLASGRCSVTVEIDEVEAVEVLCASKLLDPVQDHSREDIGHAIGKLIELLRRT